MNQQDFAYSLEIMWKGMLSIFVVIFLLTIIVLLMAKLTNKKQNTSEE